MTSRISHTTFDARDSYAQSVFWAQVLGYTDVPGDPLLFFEGAYRTTS